jgi:hypothetical protein
MLLKWSAVLALRGKSAWAHDWITDPDLISTFEALPGTSFLVQGATPAKNSALTSAGAELRLINAYRCSPSSMASSPHTRGPMRALGQRVTFGERSRSFQ